MLLFGSNEIQSKQSNGKELKMNEMTISLALQLIVDNAENPALNYAINYAKYGLSITDPEELRV